jgi:hypothetical protein
MIRWAPNLAPHGRTLLTTMEPYCWLEQFGVDSAAVCSLGVACCKHFSWSVLCPSLQLIRSWLIILFSLLRLYVSWRCFEFLESLACMIPQILRTSLRRKHFPICTLDEYAVFCETVRFALHLYCWEMRTIQMQEFFISSWAMKVRWSETVSVLCREILNPEGVPDLWRNFWGVLTTVKKRWRTFRWGMGS